MSAALRAFSRLAVCIAALGCEAEAPDPAEHDAHAGHAQIAAERPHLGHSIYQLEGAWSDQDGKSLRLESLRGNPVVAVMFYGTCEHACPILVHDVQRLEELLPDDVRAQTRVLLVTFDPERDTAERLRSYALERELPLDRWTLVRGEEWQTLELAAVLGVRYRALGDGGYSHSMLLTLLDQEGVIVRQEEGLQQDMTPLAGALGGLLRGAGAGDGSSSK